MTDNDKDYINVIREQLDRKIVRLSSKVIDLTSRIDKLENIVIYMTCASMGKLDDKEFRNLMLMLKEISIDRQSIFLANLLKRERIKTKEK